MATKPDPFEPLKAIAEDHYKKEQKRKGRKPRTKPEPKNPPKNIDSLIGLSDEDLDHLYDEVILDRELGLRSLRDFAKMCWPHMDGTRGKPYIETAWHTECLADHIQAVIEGQIKRIIISVPPGAGKSSMAAVFGPVWAWLQQPYLKMAFGSYSYANSKRDSVYCSKLIRSKWWQKRWGNIYSLVKWDQLHVETSVGGIRKVVSVGGQTLGIRADIVVADDALNIDEVDSQPARSKVHFWWEHGMRTRGDVDLLEIIIAQRLHENDLAGYMQREVGGYQELVLPAEYDPSRHCVTFTKDGTKFWEDPRKEEGELLFKEKFPRKLLDSLRGSDEKSKAMYSAMQQQLPVPPGGNIIKKHWFRYYTTSPEEQFSQCSWAIISIDLATKTTRTSQYTPSYTVLQVWGVKHPNIYLIDQIRKRLSFTEKLAIIKLFVDKWNNTEGPGLRAKLIEDKAGGSDTKETLQEKVQGIILFDGNDDKEERMEAITWLWEAGNVYVPGKPARDGEEGKVDFSHVPWVGDFVDEITSFPKSPFSDQAIAMSQALVYISKQMKKVVGSPSLVSGGPSHMYNMEQNEIGAGRKQPDIIGNERRRIIGE